MNRTIIGIDRAKNVFEVYVEDEGGQGITRCRLSRKKVLPWFANRAPALVGMEACGGAHHWAREVHEVGARGAADRSAVRQAVGADEQE